MGIAGGVAPKWRAFIAMAIAYVTIVLATTMTFVVLPEIADDFDVTLRAVGWVVIIESLIISALVLPMGAMADAIGRRRVMLAGMAVFAIGCLATGLAPSFPLLISARIIMSLGNVLVQSIGTGLLAAAFPDDERGLALGAQTSAVAIGSALGPLVGGIAIAVLSWDVLFLLLAVPSFLGVFAIAALIPNDTGDHADGRRFDNVGAALAALGITGLVVTLNNPFALPWVSAGTLACAITTIAAIIAFVRWELRSEHPMLDLRLFRIPAFRYASLVRIFAFLSATTALLLTPIYLISLRDISGVSVGLILFVYAVGMGITAQLSGRLYDAIGPRRPTIVGLCTQTVLCVGFVLIGADTALWLVALLMLGLGVSVALWNVPNNSAIIGATPAASLGVGGAFTNVTRTIGNVLGQALAAGLVVAVMDSQGFDIPLDEIGDNIGAGGSFLDGWQLAFGAAAAVAALTLAAALRLPDGPHPPA